VINDPVRRRPGQRRPGRARLATPPPRCRLRLRLRYRLARQHSIAGRRHRWIAAVARQPPP